MDRTNDSNYSSFLINHVKESIERAFLNKSKLPADVLAMEGMSGDKTRHLYNNICSLEGANYLEVGTWKGSSFISAMYANDTTYGTCVDNWSEFEGKSDFFTNMSHFIKNTNNITVLDMDCWNVGKDHIQKNVDIYLYDGAHDYQSHKRAITHFAPLFSKYVIILVDDWACDWVEVEKGTRDGIAAAPLKILFEFPINLINTNTFHVGGDTFWNGCGIFVCQRTDS